MFALGCRFDFNLSVHALADLHQHFICSTKAEQARARVLDVENDVCDYCRYDREAEDVKPNALPTARHPITG